MKEEVAKENEIKNGEFKKVIVNKVRVLVCKYNNEFYAVSASCPHYGAPLDKGLLHGERLICPWHHACFDITTGKLLEPPSRNSLNKYNVEVRGGSVLLEVPDGSKTSSKPALAARNIAEDSRNFVIVGGGASGNAAAQSLREEGFKGRIVMITEEDRLPYDRPNLSKHYLEGRAKEQWMPLEPVAFYEENKIETITGKKVVQLDTQDKTITFDDGETLSYDKALVATGGSANKLDVPGSNLDFVYTLRSFDDAEDIVKRAENSSSAVVIGASFIGMETAHSLTKRGIDVTVVAPEKIPFEKVFGIEIGNMLKKAHEDNGVRFMLDTRISGFDGNKNVKSVMFDNGESVDTDMVIVGIGIKPATGFLKKVKLESDGGVKADKYLQLAGDLYAAGDIVHFPYNKTGKTVRIEHWRTAEQLGRLAAKNMLSKNEEFASVPFFWTEQAGINIQYVGHTRKWDEIIIKGEISSKSFIAFYIEEGVVAAAAGCGHDKEMILIEELMRTKRMPYPDELRQDTINISQILIDALT